MDINKVNNVSSAQIKAFSPNVEENNIEKKENLIGKNTYMSPTIRVDMEIGIPISIFRDSETGEIEKEYPSKEVIKKYKETVN